MTPLHFGNSGRELFGVYSPPVDGSGSRRAVLLCNPFGQESIRAFRIYRLLAEHLSRDGHHVLRFDYFATGDSAGDCNAGTVAQWLADIKVAHDELADMSGASRINWLGFRLGATLALLAAQDKPRGLGGVIAWEPVLSGAAYIEELALAHAKFTHTPVAPAVALQSGNSSRPVPSIGEAFGFELSTDLVAELAAIDLHQLTSRPARKVALVTSAQESTMEPFSQHLSSLGTQVSFNEAGDSHSWNSDDAMNAFVIPAMTIGVMVSLLGGSR